MATFSLLILATLIIPLFGNPAFSAYKTEDQSGSAGDVLTFQVEQTNVGSHFDMVTNKFTCKVAGTYVFMFTIASFDSSQAPGVFLVKDGSKIAGVYILDKTYYDNFHQASNTAILQLSEGDQVWLQLANNEKVFGNYNKLVSFSGFLLSYNNCM